MLSIFKKAADPISSYTHFLGAIGFGIAGVIMTIRSAITDKSLLIWGSQLIFTLSLLALYTASATYHFMANNRKYGAALRKLDHAMIYILIAGTYTPITVTFYPENTRFIFLSCIWGIAITGILVKMFWMNAPRWISTCFYLLLGWAVIFYIKPIFDMTPPQLFLLISGGISYSIGAIIYILKKPNFSTNFGFHELFHIFVLLGTLFHFLLVWIYA